MGKSTIEESELFWLSTAGPLEDIGVNIKVIKDLVSGLPKGSVEPSTKRHFYASYSDYDRYQKEKQTQRTILAKLKMAYSILVEYHRDLWDSHEMMKKREKERDDFFSKMWKRVKGLRKVLKPYEGLLSPIVESDDEPPTKWWGFDVGVEGTKSVGESIS